MPLEPLKPTDMVRIPRMSPVDMPITTLSQKTLSVGFIWNTAGLEGDDSWRFQVSSSGM
ncbi:MAG: hypothetical protein V3W09_03130 [Nitrososphaerales archaeon]